MAIKDLATKRWDRGNQPVQADPFTSLQREMNRMFENFTRGFWEGGLEPWGEFAPKTDLSEDDQAFHVSVELPGMDEKDVQVALAGDQLTIRGEKRSEREEKNKQFHRVERSYGSFQRTIPLPAEINTEAAEATFKKGVLSVRLPKKAGAQPAARKIAVKRA